MGRSEARNAVRNPRRWKQRGEAKPGKGSKLQGEGRGQRRPEATPFLRSASRVSEVFSLAGVSHDREHGGEEGRPIAQRSRTSVKTLPSAAPFIVQWTVEPRGCELHLHADFFARYGRGLEMCSRCEFLTNVVSRVLYFKNMVYHSDNL